MERARTEHELSIRTCGLNGDGRQTNKREKRAVREERAEQASGKDKDQLPKLEKENRLGGETSEKFPPTATINLKALKTSIKNSPLIILSQLKDGDRTKWRHKQWQVTVERTD